MPSNGRGRAFRFAPVPQSARARWHTRRATVLATAAANSSFSPLVRGMKPERGSLKKEKVRREERSASASPRSRENVSILSKEWYGVLCCRRMSSQSPAKSSASPVAQLYGLSVCSQHRSPLLFIPCFPTPPPLFLPGELQTLDTALRRAGHSPPLFSHVGR